jgi:hypothetical protein
MLLCVLEDSVAVYNDRVVSVRGLLPFRFRPTVGGCPSLQLSVKYYKLLAYKTVEWLNFWCHVKIVVHDRLGNYSGRGRHREYPKDGPQTQPAS